MLFGLPPARPRFLGRPAFSGDKVFASKKNSLECGLPAFIPELVDPRRPLGSREMGWGRQGRRIHAVRRYGRRHGGRSGRRQPW